jgi:lipoprotein-anchoring transpeptidase ErfK/SrfK
MPVSRGDPMSKLASKFGGAAIAVAVVMTFIATQAQANLPRWGQGVVLVPLAGKAQRPSESAPGFKRGKIVAFAGTYEPGSIVVLTKKHALYYVLPGGKAAKYRVATGKKGFEWQGAHKISVKVKWPEWNPPEEMRKRRPELPPHMDGGPENPLGARAIYLGSSLYRIHGTNEPSSIGKSASSGCIRMLNEDVIELYDNARIGAAVIVI